MSPRISRRHVPGRGGRSRGRRSRGLARRPPPHAAVHRDHERSGPAGIRHAGAVPRPRRRSAAGRRRVAGKRRQSGRRLRDARPRHDRADRRRPRRREGLLGPLLPQGRRRRREGQPRRPQGQGGRSARPAQRRRRHLQLRPRRGGGPPAPGRRRPPRGHCRFRALRRGVHRGRLCGPGGARIARRPLGGVGRGLQRQAGGRDRLRRRPRRRTPVRGGPALRGRLRPRRVHGDGLLRAGAPERRPPLPLAFVDDRHAHGGQGHHLARAQGPPLGRRHAVAQEHVARHEQQRRPQPPRKDRLRHERAGPVHGPQPVQHLHPAGGFAGHACGKRRLCTSSTG